MIRSLPPGLGALVVVAALAVAGCGGVREVAPDRNTPADPAWSLTQTRESLRALRSAASVLERSAAATAGSKASRVADYLAQQLRRNGVQPAAEAYRLHYLQPAHSPASGRQSSALPLMVGLVAGRDPLSRKAVLVYAPLRAERISSGAPAVRAAAWLELGRVYAALGAYYRFPAQTVWLALPVMPADERHQDVLRALMQQSVWPLDEIEAVVVLGAPEADAAAWRAAGLPPTTPVAVLPISEGAAQEAAPPEEQARALARRAYAWLLPYVGAPPQPAD